MPPARGETKQQSVQQLWDYVRFDQVCSSESSLSLKTRPEQGEGTPPPLSGRNAFPPARGCIPALFLPARRAIEVRTRAKSAGGYDCPARGPMLQTTTTSTARPSGIRTSNSERSSRARRRHSGSRIAGAGSMSRRQRLAGFHGERFFDWRWVIIVKPRCDASRASLSLISLRWVDGVADNRIAPPTATACSIGQLLTHRSKVGFSPEKGLRNARIEMFAAVCCDDRARLFMRHGVFVNAFGSERIVDIRQGDDARG